MTTEMILDSIAKWQANINNGEALVGYLDQGNRFTYDNIKYPETSEYIHAYPGVFEDQLMFFLIPDAYDKEQYHDHLAEYTQVCPVFWTVAGSHTIPDKEAEARMKRWKNEYKDWVPLQTSQPVGMFKAFNIPADDFVAEGCVATLGMEIGGVEGSKTADLIIANETDKAEFQFDDYSTPVPPFSSAAAVESFYLLQICG